MFINQEEACTEFLYLLLILFYRKPHLDKDFLVAMGEIAHCISISSSFANLGRLRFNLSNLRDPRKSKSLGKNRVVHKKMLFVFLGMFIKLYGIGSLCSQPKSLCFFSQIRNFPSFPLDLV